MPAPRTTRVSRAKRGCKVPKCKRPHEALGYCAPHYARYRLYGDPEHKVTRMGGPKFTPMVLETAGLTRRQLDYWCSRGLLNCPIVNKRRVWKYNEIRIALLIQQLAAAGLSLDTSAAIARRVVDHDEVEHLLADGVSLVVIESAEAKALPKF